MILQRLEFLSRFPSTMVCANKEATEAGVSCDQVNCELCTVAFVIWSAVREYHRLP